MDVLGRIRAVDVSRAGSDVEAMEAAVNGYLDALGVTGGRIAWTDDLTEARRGYCAGRGRWPLLSTRQSKLRVRGWLEQGERLPLIRAERQLRTLLVGPGRPSHSVRLAAELTLGLELASAVGDGSSRELAASEAAVAAVEAGVMAWWPSNGHLVAVPRPAMAFEAGVLHRWDGGPAVRWSTGRELYFWRGVRVANRVGRAPERVTVSSIAATTNAERRRVMVERLGYERYLREAGAELRAQDDFGKLWVVGGRHALDSEEQLVIVEVANATAEADGARRRYFLRVPPGTRTARDAVAWTFGFDSADDYLLAAET